MRSLFISLAFVSLLPSLQLNAQQPTVLHAKVSARTADHGLAAELTQQEKGTTPAWVGYAVPVASEFHIGGRSGNVSFLEGGDHNDGYSGWKDATFDHVNLLMRIADGKIEKLRLENPDRQLDAGGLGFTWLTNTSPEDSIHILQAIARSTGPEKLRKDAVFYISLHQSPAATPALGDLTSAGMSDFIREQAAFWLANQHGHDGLVIIQRLAHDGDPHLREKVAFDLTLSHEPEAIDTLISMAKEDPSPQVRRQAQFWMANIGGKKITADLRASAETDPNEETRKSAVFALSRLPGDESTTQLIQVAKTSSDPEVRKQAVFWLGQSSNPKATDFLAQLLETRK